MAVGFQCSSIPLEFLIVRLLFFWQRMRKREGFFVRSRNGIRKHKLCWGWDGPCWSMQRNGRFQGFLVRFRHRLGRWNSFNSFRKTFRRIDRYQPTPGSYLQHQIHLPCLLRFLIIFSTLAPAYVNIHFIHPPAP